MTRDEAATYAKVDELERAAEARDQKDIAEMARALRNLLDAANRDGGDEISLED